jgi:hypothetical protein
LYISAERQLGSLLIGGISKDKPLAHWLEMSANDKDDVRQWHFLME